MLFLCLPKSAGGLSVGWQAFICQNSKHHQGRTETFLCHVICNKAAWLPLLHFPFHVMEQLVAPYVACLSAHSLQNGKEGSNCAYSPEATYRGAAGMHGCERGEMVHSLLDQFCVFLWISLNCRFNFMSLTLHGNLCKYTIWTPVYNIAVQENKRATV